MVRQRLIALLLALGAIGAQTARADLAADTPPAATVTRLTWLDCVRLTTKTNPDLQSSREAVLNSDAVRLGAYSALYPQISASFGDSRSYAGNNLFAERNYSTSYTEQISLSQLIFNGFATQANIAQARAQLNLAFANLDAQKAGTSFELKTAFAQLLDAQQLIAISGNVVGIRQDNARLVKLLYEGGSEDKGAMLLSQANLDQAQVNLDQARRTRDLAVRQLATILGQNLTPPVEAQGDLQTAPLAATPNFSKLATATPIYFQQRARVDAAAAGITLAQSGWYPTITAGASADRSDAHFPLHDHGWSAGFSVSYPIFQGGQTYFDVKAAEALLRASLDDLRSGTDQSALTLAQTYKALIDAQANVRIQLELLDATALRYKIADADYRNGLISFQDFNTITDSFVSQQLATLASQLNAVLAEANWEEARGYGAIP